MEYSILPLKVAKRWGMPVSEEDVSSGWDTNILSKMGERVISSFDDRALIRWSMQTLESMSTLLMNL